MGHGWRVTRARGSEQVRHGAALRLGHHPNFSPTPTPKPNPNPNPNPIPNQVPLSVSDITLRGRVLLQAAPHPDPPYLGRCSLSFLRPPDIDFVLRPMRAFDVMEVRRRVP